MAYDFNDPRNAAMLALGAGLLAPQQFRGLAPALSQGMLAAGNAYQQAEANNAQRGLLEARRAEHDAKLAAAAEAAQRQAMIQSQIGAILPSGASVSAGLAEVGNGPDSAAARSPQILQSPAERIALYRQFGDIYASQGDVESADKYYRLAQAEIPKLESVFDGQGREQKAFVSPDGGLQRVGEAKRPEILDPEVQKARLNLALAGRPVTNVDARTTVKMGESVAAQVGPMLRAARERTEGAINLGRSGEEIIAALDRGGVIAGPAANARLALAQLGEFLGVGGKDSAERLRNTRQVIRSLADAAVEARKRLAGQGPVTDNEAEAVKKASSGDIADLTTEELRLIAGLNIKAARLAARDYQSQISQMPEDMAGTRPFFEIPGIEQWTADPASTPAGSSRIDGLLKKYGG